MKSEQLRTLEKANKFISKFSREHEVQYRCSDRSKQIKALKKEINNKRWNGITRTENLDSRINSLAVSLTEDLPTENELRNTFKSKRGLIHEVIQASNVKTRAELHQQLGSIERSTRNAAHKVRVL